MQRFQIGLVLAALSTTALTSPANAQSMASPSVQPTPQNVSPQAADDTSADIIVTAQRRQERLKDVPISITALTGADLAKGGIVDVTQLAQVTPGLQFGVQGAYAQPQIRGIGATVAGPGADPEVAIYVDGVYMPSQNSNFFQLADVEQIDVLKGPQGTLYGRNATGGAINVTTRTPEQTPAGKFSASYGSYNQADLSGFVSGPLAGKVVSASISGFYHGDSGYSRDVLRGSRLSKLTTYGGRAKLRIEPADNLSLTFAGDASYSNDSRSYSVQIIGRNVATPGAFLPTAPRDIALSFDPLFATTQYGGSFTAKFDAGFATITNIVAKRHVNASIKVDTDRTASVNQFSSFSLRQNTLTEELNIASNGSGSFKWTAGFFYFDDDAKTLDFGSQAGISLNLTDVGSRAGAVYAQADYTLLDKLTLTAGLRYSTERRSYLAVRPSGTPLKTDGQQTWSALTPRVALRYSFNSDTNIYASWSRGFKSGIYNGTAFSNVPVNPETVDAYEVGFKYGSGSTSISIAGFHYDYKDIQVQILTNGSSGPTSVTTNAAGARIDGAEAQISYHLARGLSANIGVALTSARYTSFPAALTYIPKATAALCGVNPIPCGNVSQPTDVSGNQIVRTPKFTANFGIDYSVPLAGGKLAANANVYYNGGYYWDVSNRLRQGQYEVLNASIGWSPDRAHWKFSVWGRNLTNQAYSFYEASTTAGDFRSFAAPRSIGVKAEYSF